jgi:hypothetical protein
MSGVFVVPKDKLVAYVEYRGYTAVMYTDGKNGEQPMGVGVVLAASGDGHRHLAEAVVPDYLLKPRFSFASQRVPLKKRVT